MNSIKVRFASKEEAQKLILGNTQYYNRLSQMDIDWRARKADATLDELIAFAQEQVSDFTESDMDVVMQCMSFIERQLDLFGCQLPVPDEIIFVKTTMKDESNASAYTTRNQIFLNESFLNRYNDPRRRIGPRGPLNLSVLLAHELFHCVTRHSPEFRKKMYDLIGFTIMDHDIEFPEHINRTLLSNPDVEHIDNYAEFTIDGVKRKCALITTYSMPWAEASDQYGPAVRFFSHLDISLVALDDLAHPFYYEEASDFWEKMGKNTNYVNAPEECLAVNFSYAIIFGMDYEYKTPELIRSILSALK